MINFKKTKEMEVIHLNQSTLGVTNRTWRSTSSVIFLSSFFRKSEGNRQFVATIVTMLLTFCCIGFTGCSSDKDSPDNPSSSKSKGSIVLGGKTTKLAGGTIDEASYGEIDITLVSFDMKNIINGGMSHMPTKVDGEVYISLNLSQMISDGQKINVPPTDYMIEFLRDVDNSYEGDDYTAAVGSAWGWMPWSSFLQTKTPSDLTISRSGDNYSIEIKDLWLCGGENCDGWESSSVIEPSYIWASGSLSWSGKLYNDDDIPWYGDED